MRTQILSTLLVSSSLLLAPVAQAAVPSSTSVSDPAADQTHGTLWNKYPALRPQADLRRAVFAVENTRQTLRMTWTFAASPGAARVYQTPAMSATLGGKTITFSAWRRDNGKTYTAAFSSGSSGAYIGYCARKMTVAVNKTAKTVTMRVPISCLPAGRVLDNPYPSSYLTVLKSGSEVVEGTVGSDSQYAAPDLVLR